MVWEQDEGHLLHQLAIPAIFPTTEAEAGPGLKPAFPDELSTTLNVPKWEPFNMPFPTQTLQGKLYLQKVWL